MIKELLKAKVICIDFETQSDAGGKKGNMEYWHPHSRIVSMSITIQDGDTYVIPLSHPEGPWKNNWRQVLINIGKAILKNQDLKWVAHNAKYEINWHYAMTGQALEDKLWWDTVMSSYLMDENVTHNLKDLAVRELGVDYWDEVNLKDSEAVAWSALALYNARDTDYCLRLVPLHRQALTEEARLGRLFHFWGMPLIRTLARIERNGLPLDHEVVLDRKKKAEQKVKELSAKLLKIATDEWGMDLELYPTISWSNSKFFTAFMETSGLPVITYTPTGNASWAADVLETLEIQGYEIARDILDVRRNSNKLSKFFRPWLKMAGEDKRLHPTFNPMIVDDKWQSAKGTKTGRLSSSNPNAQQIARDEKQCFGGEDGWLFVELDYSQIELRVLAWLANVPKVLKAYEEGQDLHTLMAAAINEIDPSQVTPDQRQGGKAGNFGFAYEMGERTYVEYAWNEYKVKVTLDEARKVRKAFFDDQWYGLARWHERQKNLAHRHGYVRNPFGRKRRLPEIRSSNGYEIGRAERRAINAPIQSAASDLMGLALIEIDRQMDPNQVRLVGTVHDSLLAQLREDTWEQNLERMARIMLDPGTEKKFGVKIGVPLAVEAKVGYHWNDPDGVTRVFS